MTAPQHAARVNCAVRVAVGAALFCMLLAWLTGSREA